MELDEDYTAIYLKNELRIGRVEVCLDESYGTVCDRDFGEEEASVVCRQLGFSPYGMQFISLAIKGLQII